MSIDRQEWMQKARTGSFVCRRTIDGHVFEQFLWGGGRHTFVDGDWRPGEFEDIVQSITRRTDNERRQTAGRAASRRSA